MRSLSIVLATYNEERNLSECLDSVKSIADEIIIVDGSSTDTTVAIAHKYNAKVTVTTNPQIFHINKQKAIDQATKDWILQLDADERVTEALKKEIIAKINNKEEIAGYWIPRKNWFLGRFLMKGGQYPDYTLRLYQRGKGRLPQKDVHEQAEISGKVGYLHSPLLHYPYKNFNNYLEKWNRYVVIISTQTKKERENKNALLQVFYGFDQLVIAPIVWFFLTYFRHKGFMDYQQGFIFAFFSALRFPASYIYSLSSK